jgi:hypothetical protein
MSRFGLEPHVSVVATSRNDDHGGDLRKRMQVFVGGLAAQADRHRLPLELVLVEWNPPADRPPLLDALRWPERGEHFEARIVTVPAAVHSRFDPTGALPLFQMLAKNAGIRRARGRFVLATNVDLLFPDELFRTLRDRLEAGVLYRSDRLDVSPQIEEEAPVEQQLAFCRANVLRRHRARGTFVRSGGRWTNASPGLLSLLVGRVRQRLRSGGAQARPSSSTPASEGPAGGRQRTGRHAMAAFVELVRIRHKCRTLHINGCGDFTLLDRETWYRLRGYPEWIAFSWHLDSVLLFQADANRVPFRSLPEEQCVYHVDHAGGWRPGDQERLLTRMAEKGIRVLSDEELNALHREMRDRRRRRQPVVFNAESWGLAGTELPETTL